MHQLLVCVSCVCLSVSSLKRSPGFPTVKSKLSKQSTVNSQNFDAALFTRVQINLWQIMSLADYVYKITLDNHNELNNNEFKSMAMFPSQGSPDQFCPTHSLKTYSKFIGTPNYTIGESVVVRRCFCVPCTHCKDRTDSNFIS